jgi:hypothetical protein
MTFILNLFTSLLEASLYHTLQTNMYKCVVNFILASHQPISAYGHIYLWWLIIKIHVVQKHIHVLLYVNLNLYMILKVKFFFLCYWYEVSTMTNFCQKICGAHVNSFFSTEFSRYTWVRNRTPNHMLKRTNTLTT